MFDLLTEVKKMKTMMGLIKEDQDLESINKHAQNILNILKFSNLYSSTIKKLIDKIIKFGETNIIDFDLIESLLKTMPDVNFEFYGIIRSGGNRIDALSQYKNFHWHGQIHPQDIPQFLSLLRQSY